MYSSLIEATFAASVSTPAYASDTAIVPLNVQVNLIHHLSTTLEGQHVYYFHQSSVTSASSTT